MAREKKKADRPTEVRSKDEAPSDFSGLGGDVPPLVTAPAKESVASKGASPSPGGVPASAKPRPRKASPSPVVPLLPAPVPAARVVEPVPDLTGQAREAASLLESIVRQCREAQAQLQGELEQRRGVAQEVEALRQRSQEAHVAHKQLLAQTREGAEQVMRECAAAALQVAEAAQQVEALRPQMQGIQESLLYEVEVATAGTERVKQERAAAASQLAEAGEEFARVRHHFFERFEQEVGKLHQRLRETGESMQDLPRQAEEVRQRLAEVGAEVRAFEQSASAARQKREALDLETARAEAHLARLRDEVADTEGRLASVRRELDESRRRQQPAKPPVEPAKSAPEPVAEPAPPPAPEPRNHLGITVDHGVIVAEVAPGTPAAAAGLIRGDILTAVNGIPVLSGPELRDLILEEEGAEDIVLRLTRGGIASEAKVRFERHGGSDEIPLGATVESGVVVAEVAPNTPASAVGLVRGDIITAINGEEVFTGGQLRDAVQRLAGGAAVTIRFTRAGEKHEATTRLDEV